MIVAVVCVTLLKFNTPLGYPLTLNLFAYTVPLLASRGVGLLLDSRTLEVVGVAWIVELFDLLMHMVVWAGIVAIWPWNR